jgi:hypothetical protein
MMHFILSYRLRLRLLGAACPDRLIHLHFVILILLVKIQNYESPQIYYYFLRSFPIRNLDAFIISLTCALDY